MRQIYKRLLTTLLLISATQTSSVVQAEGIRLVGPSGEVQSSPHYAEEIERVLPAPPANSEPSRFIGPTGENQTLWSIASQIRPSRSVSVQQTLFAIYRINPRAFENQNIHELIPGSRLRVPSLEQIKSATTAQAVAIMKAHEAKLVKSPVKKAAPVQRVVQQPKPQLSPRQEVTLPQSTSQAADKVEPFKVGEPTSPIPPVKTSPQGEQQVTELKNKLQGSQSELVSLEEKNHRLRLMLSEVQNEVQTLKNELNDEERIRSEVEKLLAEERQRAAEQQRLQPSTLDQLLSNGWLVALAALIPGALIAFLVVLLIGRRSKEKEEPVAEQQSTVDASAAPIAMAAADELEEELSLDDDLFADEEIGNFSENESIAELEDDVFAGLEDEDLDFNLESDDGEDPFAGIDDDGDLDVGFDEFESSTNGIKVNGEEKALGLEEMERALDKVTPDLDAVDDPDFDLSDADSSNINQDDVFDEIPLEDESTEKADSTHVDQTTLDELFAELDSDDLDLSSDASQVAGSAFSADDASDDEIDKLLAQYEQPSQISDSDIEPLLGSHNQENVNKGYDVDLFERSEDSLDSNDSDDIDENSTDLLDELIGFDDDDSDVEFDPLNELESLSGFDGQNIEELDADSVELLDEFLDDEASSESEDDVSLELDPFDELIREDEEFDAEKLQEEEDDLLASLGFDDLESEQDETSDNGKQEQTKVAQRENDDDELGSALDIEALLAENHLQDAQEEPELTKPEKETGDEVISDEFLDDLEDISLEPDPLMHELDELFESSLDEKQTAEQSNDTVSSDSESPRGKQEQSESTGSLVQQEALVEDKSALLDESPVVFDEPGSTPTPNAVENEFGMPQEEDWSLDDIDPESEPAISEADEEFDFDESELPEFGEEDALASMSDEPELPESEPAISEADEEFDFDESELPEFGEEDALASMADEPELPESEPVISEADEEFDFDESELPDFDENDALASMPERHSSQVTQSDAPRMKLQADNDHDALFEVFAQQHSLDEERESPKVSDESKLTGFAESDMENLLSEKGESEVFEAKLDSDTIDSAGMDFDTMLDVGDDWDGFKSTSDAVSESGSAEVPDEEREIWESEEALIAPEIAQENWEQQSDLEDFDPKKSQFMTIDELMAQVDQEGGEFEEEELKLDVGLNEFPDVIGDINDVDVDSDAEAAGKLDLAKIYLEMNDPKGAIKLLEEAIVYGEDETRREAKNLIDTINGR